MFEKDGMWMVIPCLGQPCWNDNKRIESHASPAKVWSELHQSSGLGTSISCIYIYIYKCIYLKTWLARMETWQKSWDLYLRDASYRNRPPASWQESHTIVRTKVWIVQFKLQLVKPFPEITCSFWTFCGAFELVLHNHPPVPPDPWVACEEQPYTSLWPWPLALKRSGWLPLTSTGSWGKSKESFLRLTFQSWTFAQREKNIFPTQWAADFLSFVSSIKARDVLIKNVSHSLIFVHHCCVSHMLWGKYSVSILRRTLWNASTFLGWGKMTLRTGAVGDMYIYNIYIMHSNT